MIITTTTNIYVTYLVVIGVLHQLQCMQFYIMKMLYCDTVSVENSN